ncbi:hypothetical protein TEA_012693 [Camellia sinensis var. sinensis]|uniref:ACT domain-containing protein ACR n=1 Tax=Camellia sinensis var. sinensis TaxID=542762 RepID=A0A4S4EPX0_CAMSN|nr:hypothetical protein TEA_012693 [Camellia sinensis var. sinensis]
MDRPGLISEISAVLTELGCLVTAAVAWTHNSRMACIIYVEKECKGGKPITEVQAQLENVVEAHHCDGEKRSMRLTSPAAGRTRTERRLHQLMSTDGDYEGYCCSSPGCHRGGGSGGGVLKTHSSYQPPPVIFNPAFIASSPAKFFGSDDPSNRTSLYMLKTHSWKLRNNANRNNGTSADSSLRTQLQLQLQLHSAEAFTLVLFQLTLILLHATY